MVWLLKDLHFGERNTLITICDWICKNRPSVTLGQLHFVGHAANSHTHTLPMHCYIDGLSWLVCFNGAGFADHVKSWLRQWGPWRALNGRYGSNIHLCVSEVSLKPLQAYLGLWLVVLGLIASPNSPIERLTGNSFGGGILPFSLS